MRKLASIQKIKNVEPIELSDNLELAIVNGWQVVIQKGSYKKDDKIIFCEIDSWIPYSIAPYLSKGKEPKIYKGIAGARLKTLKLRGALSQGLVLPLTVEGEEGDDVSELLGVIKWERETEYTINCKNSFDKREFPIWVPKTDQERVQNLVDVLHTYTDSKYLVTEKLDGTSMTIFLEGDRFGVCSRNYEVVEGDNIYWRAVKELGLEDKIRNLALLKGCTNIAVQGELVGPSIQGNYYDLPNLKFYVFDVLVDGNYLTGLEMFTHTQSHISLFELVPHVAYINTIPPLEDLLKLSDGYSALVNKFREGIVVRTFYTARKSFKVISNDYLLDNEN